MDDQYFVFATAGIILVYFLVNVVVRKFDPFAPVWLFLLGYVQVYIIQAVSYHEWALRGSGQELVTAANSRALWAIIWFLTVYHLGIGPRSPLSYLGRLADGRRPWSLPSWPLRWFSGDLFCAGVMIRGGITGAETISAEEALLRSFPFVMMVAAIMLIVTGRTLAVPSPLFLPAGLLVAASLRCHLDVQRQALTFADRCSFHGLCLLYHASESGPHGRFCWPLLSRRALVVAIAIGWRNNDDYELSFVGIHSVSLGFQDRKDPRKSQYQGRRKTARVETTTYETTEYGGFLLMMDTVPRNRIMITEPIIFAYRFYIYPSNRLAHQAALRPGPVGQRLDRWLGDGSRRGIHKPGNRDPRGHTAQRRCCRDPHCPGLHRSSSPHRLRVFPPPLGRPLGPVLVGDHLLQRMVHGRE